MHHAYLETIALIERLHRRCLTVVRNELDRTGVRDLTAVQAMLLYNLDGEQLTVGELTRKGYYLGTSVSYNVKKLVANGYLVQTPSKHDRRASLLHCSPRGREVAAQIHALFERHATALASESLSDDQLDTTVQTLQAIERDWVSSEPD